MNLVRKIKISKITSVEFTEKEKEIIDFINSKLSDLIPFKHDNYPLSIFYMSSNGKWILEQDNNIDRLYIRFDNFWQVLQTKYSMGYNDIQILLQYMVEQAFKEKVTSLRIRGRSKDNQIEQSFKEKISSLMWTSFDFTIVEDSFKQVSTPSMAGLFIQTWAEQAFNQKVSMPEESITSFVEEVEDAFKKVSKTKSNSNKKR